MNSKEREDKKETKVIKGMEDWGRHIDILLWTVTAIMATAIGGLLVCMTNEFDMWLALAGFIFTIIAVYFAASFREVRHKIGEYYPDGIKEILHSRKLSQWWAYRLIFAILAILYIKLLIENCNDLWLICLWFIIGSIGTIRIMLLEYEEERNGKSKEDWDMTNEIQIEDNHIKLYILLADQLQKNNAILWQVPTALIIANLLALEKFLSKPFLLFSLSIFNFVFIYAYHRMIVGQYALVKAKKKIECELKKTFNIFIPEFPEPKMKVEAGRLLVSTLVILNIVLIIYSTLLLTWRWGGLS